MPRPARLGHRRAGVTGRRRTGRGMPVARRVQCLGRAPVPTGAPPSERLNQEVGHAGGKHHARRADQEGGRGALRHVPAERLVRGKRVAVKPNDTWASATNHGGDRQDTLRAVLRCVKRFGPHELIVSGGSGAAETRTCSECRPDDVVEQEGAVFFRPQPPAVQRGRARLRPERDVTVPEVGPGQPRVLEYEALISLAQLKLHETATVTLGLKNIAMSFPAADLLRPPPPLPEARECLL